MSLFTAALGGIGRGAADIADQYIKTEEAMTLQQHQALVQRDRDEFVNGLRLKADSAQTAGRLQAEKDTMAFKNSPEQIDADVRRESAISRAKNETATHVIGQGTQLMDGTGKVLGANATETPAQIQERLYREGLKGPGAGFGGGASFDTKDRAKRQRDEEIEFSKLVKPDRFKREDGTVDNAQYLTHSTLGRIGLDAGLPADQADSRAAMALAKANEFAQTISTKSTWGGMGKDTLDPDLLKKNVEKVYANMRAKMPSDKLFDPATYSDKPAAAKDASSGASSLPPAKSIATRLIGDSSSLPNSPQLAALNQQFEAETREIESGKRPKYTPSLIEEMKRLEAERAGARDDSRAGYIQRQKDAAMARSRAQAQGAAF